MGYAWRLLWFLWFTILSAMLVLGMYLSGEKMNFIFFIIPVISGIIGIGIGYILDRRDYKEKIRKEELEAIEKELYRQQQLKEQAEIAYKNWCNNLWGMYNNVINQAWAMDMTFNSVVYYEEISKQLNVPASETDNRYTQTYEQYKCEHIKCLKDKLFNLMRDNSNNQIKDLTIIVRSVNLLHCLNCVEDNTINKKALETVHNVYNIIKSSLIYLEEKSYGDFIFLLDDACAFQETKSIIETRGLNQLSQYFNQLSSNKDNLIETLTEWEGYVKLASKTIWYYAKLKPFDLDSFNLSIDLFNKYTLTNEIAKVEVLLARIYSKNQLGGKELVRQELKTMEDWIMKKKDFSNDECILLASGLAWMELYEIELYLLRKFVEVGIRLPEKVQERLSFLENGGIADIKVYQIEPSNDFMFDSDSLDWNAKEYSIFFRKLAMKKIDMNYSLAHTKWTKTIPLVSGQKISFDKLYNEFVQLAEDFDGEITCETALARAVNLKNLEYPNATIFRFTKEKERNRCISVLVSCEKYGRNFNTTIITMFTPDNSLEVDLLEQYCQAIKNNRYVDSFRESISQVIDTILNPRQSTYGDVFE